MLFKNKNIYFLSILLMPFQHAERYLHTVWIHLRNCELLEDSGSFKELLYNSKQILPFFITVSWKTIDCMIELS